MASNAIATLLKRVFSSDPRPSLQEKLELLEQRVQESERDADERLRRRHD